MLEVRMVHAQDELGLVAAGTNMGPRWLTVAVVGLFLFVTTGSGLVDALLPRDLPALEGTERVQDERQRRTAKLSDGSLARLIERDARIRSRVGSIVRTPYAWFLYTRFAEAKDVLVGRDRWLFMKSRAEPPELPAPVVTQQAIRQLAALQRLLHSFGTKLVVAPIPRKSVVLEDDLPAGVDPDRSVDELLIAGLRDHGLPTADLLAAFAGTEPREIYHFADSHWTGEAEILAAEEIARAGGFRLPPEERETFVRATDDPVMGIDLLSWIGAEIDGPTNPCMQKYWRKQYNVFHKRDGTRVRRNRPELGRIVHVGTSFSTRRSLAVMLAHCSGEFVTNGSAPGHGPMKPLRDLFATIGDAPWPEICVLEFPIHLVLGGRGIKLTADVFSDWAPEPCTPLHAQSAWEIFPLEGGRGWRRAGVLPAGNVHHTGDGVVYAQLRGRTRSDVRVLVDTGMRHEFVWPAGQSELTVPLIHSEPTSARVLLHIDSAQAQRVELSEVRLVTPSAREARRQAPFAAPTVPAAGEWLQTARFSDDASLSEQDVLILETGPRRVPGVVTVELRTQESTAAQRFLFRAPQPGSRFALNLTPWSGQTLETVTCRGQGPRPRAGLVQASLHSPARR